MSLQEQGFISSDPHNGLTEWPLASRPEPLQQTRSAVDWYKSNTQGETWARQHRDDPPVSGAGRAAAPHCPGQAVQVGRGGAAGLDQGLGNVAQAVHSLTLDIHTIRW